ncbi:MAG TPA: efflux RND transporter periplasmic adaptor subunit [Candidatus Saccharimonadales bacterium]|nr:efflux RND transporter periplasmic adaptor subunit [Candidatus Saccharimonadales bacterium]
MDVRIAHPLAAKTDDSYPSSLYVERDVKLAARTSGIIDDVLVDRGARVKAGDPLAVLETDIAERELELAGEDARLAQAEYERVLPLHEKKIVSDQQYVQAEVARDQAVTRRELARARLERCTIRAPFDGTIVERWAVKGMRLQEEDGVPLFRIVASEPLRARVDLPETKLGSLKAGSPAFVDDLSADEVHPARVVFVSPAIDAASGTVAVIVQMVRHEEHLRLGSAVRVRFEPAVASGVQTVEIPRTALANLTPRENEDTRVMVIRNGRAEARRVRIVALRGESVVVEGKVSTDDEVILEGSTVVREGDPVVGRTEPL